MQLRANADNTIILKSPREIAIMREAGAVVSAVIQALQEQAEPGMTTRDLDEIAGRMFAEVGAESTALGYFGYPGQICVSVNDEVVHGIPGNRRLKRGDLVKADVAARYRGYVGDRTHAFGIGGNEALSARARDLARVTEEALFQGIAQACVGNRLSDIGAAIERTSSCTACRSCAISSATASDATCTRHRRCTTTARPDAARCSARAW